MAFGIDDALTAAASSVKLGDTVVRTVKAYRKKKVPLDIERLIEEVRVTALQRIDNADLALVKLERTLIDKGISLDRTLQQSINATPWWEPFEAYRLKDIKQGFDALADAAYGAVDDIASLVRCRKMTEEMGALLWIARRLNRNLPNSYWLRLLSRTQLSFYEKNSRIKRMRCNEAILAARLSESRDSHRSRQFVIQAFASTMSLSDKLSGGIASFRRRIGNPLA